MPDHSITRRGFLGLGAAAAGVAAGLAAGVALPGTGSAAVLPLSTPATLIDPYTGAIPMVFPLADGTYSNPVDAGWHTGREGRPSAWNHADGPARAHDGVDTYPRPGTAPTVYAPLSGTVAAVCVIAANRPDAAVSYAVSDSTPPPWDYSHGVDDVAHLPLYGNFVWIHSADPASRGYFLLFCHLRNEPTIRSLRPDQPVDARTRLGVIGDSGNAEGTPQLHTEIHYPTDFSYPCARCTGGRVLTSVNPAASLRGAARRPALPS